MIPLFKVLSMITLNYFYIKTDLINESMTNRIDYNLSTSALVKGQ